MGILPKRCGKMDNDRKALKKQLLVLSSNLRALVDETDFYINRDNAVKPFDPEDTILKYLQSSVLNCKQKLDKLKIKTTKQLFSEARKFIDTEYLSFFELIKRLFVNITTQSPVEIFSRRRWGEGRIETLLAADYILISLNYRNMKETVNRFFIQGYKRADKLIVDEHSVLFDVKNLTSVKFPSVYEDIRKYSASLVEGLSPELSSEKMILEQQISEIIKNAIRHGNQKDPKKSVLVWYGYEKNSFRIIVEDEGPGFSALEEWNVFYAARNEALKKNDIETMMKYINYVNSQSTPEDGGNSLIAAMEFWDSGLVYNQKRNKVAAMKYFN
jgi:serine/threonine-protein kinase RsbW